MNYSVIGNTQLGRAEFIIVCVTQILLPTTGNDSNMKNKIILI